MKGVILAAGKGTRLYPVTRAIAKPLLPLANRLTLAYAFDHLVEMDITEICLVAGPGNIDQMREALGDGSEFGVKLSYVVQTDPQGLAHALGFARDFVDRDPFVLYLGDAYYDGSFTTHADRFRASGAANLNIVQRVADPSRFGVAEVEGERIVHLVEKPKEPRSDLAMAGLYFFGPQIWDVLPSLAPSARGEYEITDAIQELLNRGETVLAGIHEGTWFDTGTRESYLACTRHILAGENRIVGKLSGDAGQDVVIGAGATVTCASIENSVVLPEARVHAPGQVISGSILGGELQGGEFEAKIRFGNLEP